MKKIIVSVLFTILLSFCFAQTDTDAEGKTRKFRKELLFTGGSLLLSFGSNGTALGATPIFGYSLTRWLDAGLLFNFVYNSQRNLPDIYGNITDVKGRQNLFGPGAFMRIYPVKFLFAQIQSEFNFIRTKYIFPDNTPDYIVRTSPSSLLVGAGYCQGRFAPGEMFFYVSLLFDVAKNPDSPYVDDRGLGRVDVLPIIRAGIQIPLFQRSR